YYVLFAPSDTSRWNGNLKKYLVTPDAKIVEADGTTEVISEVTGFFKDDAQSVWSDVVDGAAVEDGGAANELAVNRKLFGIVNGESDTPTLFNDTSIENSIIRFLDEAVVKNGVNIGDIDSAITGLEFPGSLGDVVPSQLSELTNLENKMAVAAFALGYDIDNELDGGSDRGNYYMGDSLHGTPYVLTYGTTADNEQGNDEDIVYFSSNQGLLHAVYGEHNQSDHTQAPGGSELWAYVPDPDLYENLGKYYNRTSTEHIYGLDGEISFLVDRKETGNGIDRAYLYFGQRRGGDKVFAVDVTNGDGSDANKPPVEKLWTVDGGQAPFTNLAQTWSKPIATKLNVCTGSTCGLKDVVAFSGGYDVAYDDEDASVTGLGGSVAGNAIYIVDAETGELVWMASDTIASGYAGLAIPEMDQSFPAAPTMLDVDQDGGVDIIFAMDISGQVFRIDFRTSPDDIETKIVKGASNQGVAGIIADLSETDVDRRFFNVLNATILPADNGAPARFALVTGSGYRAHPLENEPFTNRFYVLFDRNTSLPQFDDNDNVVYEYAGTDLLPATIDMDDSANDLETVDDSTPLDPANVHEHGFYVDLAEVGEKILSPMLLTNFKAIGVSYIPDYAFVETTTFSDSCTANVGNSNAHQLDLLTGAVSTVELKKPGLTAKPVRLNLLDDNGELQPVVIIGTEPFQGAQRNDPGRECVDGSGGEFDVCATDAGKARKMFWWEEDRQN
ncbi:MAG: PilC/PilY family type IV pilus protein, partial [Pseudomonadota bacterium]